MKWGALIISFVLGKEMRKKELLLSICISTYEKGTKCRQLVESILELDDERYDIQICDDNSSAECISILNQIKSEKVKLKTNKENIGACKNWYRTIEASDGKYALHVLDRDSVNIHALKLLLDFLEEEKAECGHCGMAADFKDGTIYDLENKDMFIFQSGRDALMAMGGIPVHPTGFVIKKALWEQYDFKKYFYEEEKYGIYPHSYVLGIIACKSKMFWFAVDFYSYQYTGDSKKSRFYSKSGRNYYWIPSECIFTQMTLINELTAFLDKNLVEVFTNNRIIDCYKRATIGYRQSLSNYFEMSHYGLKTRYITSTELVLLSFYVMISLSFYSNRVSLEYIFNGFIDNIRLIAKDNTLRK